jgi:enolase
MKKWGNTILIGDDLLVTNVKRLKQAINEKACNAVLIKVNQIGTLSETIACIKLAKKNKMKVVVSHRSGETTDDFISDLAVGAGADFLKSGSLSRGERICKYNRLLKIEEEI